MSRQWMIDRGLGRAPGVHTARSVLALICDAQVSDSAEISDVENGESYSLREWRKTFGQIPEECGLSDQESEIAKMSHGFGTGAFFSAVQIGQIMNLPLEQVERIAIEARRKLQGLPGAAEVVGEKAAWRVGEKAASDAQETRTAVSHGRSPTLAGQPGGSTSSRSDLGSRSGVGLDR